MSPDSDFNDWLWRMGDPVKIGPRQAGLTGMPRELVSFLRHWAGPELVVCAPLCTRKELVGLLLLGPHAGRNYHRADLDILATLANHAALAIQAHQAQEKVREAKALESFSKLSSFVVHDFRNILSILAMLSENARVNMHDKIFRESLVQTLSLSVTKMRETLSRISMKATRMDIYWEKIAIDPTISGFLREMSIPATMTPRCRLKSAATVLSDVAQLRRVLENLVLNAVEAQSARGEIRIATHEIARTVLPEKCRRHWTAMAAVDITVADDGPGMSADFIANKLFKPFQTTKKKGLGLGLYQCQETIEALGGTIWVDSEVGIGSTFHVLLPVVAEQTAAAHSNSMNGTRGGKGVKTS